MRVLFHRYVFFTALAACVYAGLFVFEFLTAKIPHDYMSSAQVLRDASNAILGILVMGAFFMFASALGVGVDQVIESAIEVTPDYVRFVLKKLGAIALLAMGGSGVFAAIVEIFQEINLHTILGFWHATTFCEVAPPESHMRCPVETPIVSWIINAPLFVIYGVIGLLLIRRGIALYREV